MNKKEARNEILKRIQRLNKRIDNMIIDGKAYKTSPEVAEHERLTKLLIQYV